jgi:hypothetical protein
MAMLSTVHQPVEIMAFVVRLTERMPSSGCHDRQHPAATAGPFRSVYNWKTVCITLTCLAMSHARADEFVPNDRAIGFVTAVALDDFRTAQSGGGYLLSYDSGETATSLRAKIARWLSGKDPNALAMGPSEKQTLFAFYWAATMMPRGSKCFIRIAYPSCQHDLAGWLARELHDDPRFLSDYEASAHALGLPPLAVLRRK